MAENTHVVSELLFYIQNKIHVAPKETIVETCTNFFSLEEVSNAKSTLEKVLNVRLSARNKSDNFKSKLISDLYEKIWSIDGSATQISCFVAADLSRIPQGNEESSSHATIEQLLASMHGLRKIVSGLQQSMVTRAMLEKTLSCFSNPGSSASSSSASHSGPGWGQNLEAKGRPRQ